MNDSDNKIKYQSILSNDYYNNFQDLTNKDNENLFIASKSDLDVKLNRRFILNHKDKNVKLIFDIKIAK